MRGSFKSLQPVIGINYVIVGSNKKVSLWEMLKHIREFFVRSYISLYISDHQSSFTLLV